MSHFKSPLALAPAPSWSSVPPRPPRQQVATLVPFRIGIRSMLCSTSTSRTARLPPTGLPSGPPSPTPPSTNGAPPPPPKSIATTPSTRARSAGSTTAPTTAPGPSETLRSTTPITSSPRCTSKLSGGTSTPTPPPASASTTTSPAPTASRWWRPTVAAGHTTPPPPTPSPSPPPSPTTATPTPYSASHAMPFTAATQSPR